MRAKYWVVAALMALLIVPGLIAQSKAIPKKIPVSIPFDFFVGSQMMPAGSYEILLDEPYMDAVTLRNVDKPTITSVTRLSQTVGQTPPKENKLMFRRDGDRYVLHQVWINTLEHGHDLLHKTDVPELEIK